jgi:Domain of unknown function (DUF4177)
MSTRWQYKVVEITQWMGTKPKKIEDVLVPLGQLGWELVAVTLVAPTTLLYLKKPA